MNTARRFSPVWIVVSGAVFLLNLFLHLTVEDFFDGFATRFGFTAYDETTRQVVLCVGVLALGAAWLWPRGHRLAFGTAATLLFAAALVAQRLIIVVAIENIHYPQYVVMVVLLAFALPSLEWAWLGATFLGAIDEAYQFAVLPRGTPGYFDWNDVVLDGIGAAMGIVIVLLWRRAPRGAGTGRPDAATWLKSSPRWAICAAGLLTALAVAPPAWSPFFTTTPGGRLFHKVAASEAVFVLSLLWWGASALARRVQTLSTSL